MISFFNFFDAYSFGRSSSSTVKPDADLRRQFVKRLMPKLERFLDKGAACRHRNLHGFTPLFECEPSLSTAGQRSIEDLAAYSPGR